MIGPCNKLPVTFLAPSGEGQRFIYKNISKSPIQISNVSEKINNQAYGLFGGKPGRKGYLFIRMANGKKKITPPKGHDKLMPGEALVMELPGGGGYGKIV